MHVKKQQNWKWNNKMAQNWERNTSRLYMSPCSFNLYAEYIMQNARLDEAQAGFKIVGRIINNLRYADDHLYGRKWRRTKEPFDESEREEWKSQLKTQHSKIKIMASRPMTSWQMDGETMETVTDFILLGSKITGFTVMDCSHEIARYLLLGRKAMINLDSILKTRDITLLICWQRSLLLKLWFFQ